jgi:hypothetical protein
VKDKSNREIMAVGVEEHRLYTLQDVAVTNYGRYKVHYGRVIAQFVGRV